VRARGVFEYVKAMPGFIMIEEVKICTCCNRLRDKLFDLIIDHRRIVPCPDNEQWRQLILLLAEVVGRRMLLESFLADIL